MNHQLSVRDVKSSQNRRLVPVKLMKNINPIHVYSPTFEPSGHVDLLLCKCEATLVFGFIHAHIWPALCFSVR